MVVALEHKPLSGSPVTELVDVPALLTGVDEAVLPRPIAAPEQAWYCRTCAMPVAKAQHAFAFRAASAVQVFPNPMGQMMKIITLRTAHNIERVGQASIEFTWFDRYMWSVAVCTRCHTQLGWRYDAVDDDAPAHFYGLLLRALRAQTK